MESTSELWAPKGVEIVEGLSSLREVQCVSRLKKSSRVLVVGGAYSFESCQIRQKFADLFISDFNVHLVTSKHPDAKAILGLMEKIAKTKPDLIIAVGGGKVLDVVKSARVFMAANIARSMNEVSRSIQNKSVTLIGDPIPVVHIPLTAGTGAEITPFAVAYVEGVKYSVVDQKMMPSAIVFDPELLLVAPRKVRASCALDALSQCIESFWSVKGTDESRNFARKGLQHIIPNIKSAVNEGDIDAMIEMQKGAYFSGLAISTSKTTAAHAMSYPLSIRFGIPHGHAVFLSLPYFFKINWNHKERSIQESISREWVQRTMDELGRLLMIEGASQAKSHLQLLVTELGLSADLKSQGIDSSLLQTLVSESFNPDRVINNPVVVDKEMVRRILADLSGMNI